MEGNLQWTGFAFNLYISSQNLNQCSFVLIGQGVYCGGLLQYFPYSIVYIGPVGFHNIVGKAITVVPVAVVYAKGGEQA
jgi:hypothetical protein